MGFWSLAAYGAGRMAGRVGEELRKERETRQEMQRTASLERFRGRQRVQEQTLLEVMKDSLPGAQAQRKQNEAQAGYLGAQAAQTTAETEQLPYQNETNRIAAQAQQTNAQTGMRNAETDAQREARLRATGGAKESSAEAKEDREQLWLDWKIGHSAASVDEMFSEAQRLRLNSKDHKGYGDWLSKVYGPTVSARIRTGQKPTGPTPPPALVPGGSAYDTTGLGAPEPQMAAAPPPTPGAAVVQGAAATAATPPIQGRMFTPSRPLPIGGQEAGRGPAGALGQQAPTPQELLAEGRRLYPGVPDTTLMRIIQTRLGGTRQ